MTSPQWMSIVSQNRAKRYKNHKYNLILLCKEHHNLIHSGKLTVNGFVMTDRGLELHYNDNSKEN